MKYAKERFLEFFRRVSHPRYWIQNHRTSFAYSEYLNDLLDKHGVKIVPILPGVSPRNLGSAWLVKVGEIYVWKRNYPYSFGTQELSHVPFGYRGVLPTVKVRKKLRKMIQAKAKEGNYFYDDGYEYQRAIL